MEYTQGLPVDQNCPYCLSGYRSSITGLPLRDLCVSVVN